MEKKSNKKILEGVVSSNKMVSTVKVTVEQPMSHPVYRKVMRLRKSYLAHVDREVNVGDKVKIIESKPYSKRVKWLVI